MQKSIIEIKSFDFAIRIVKLYQYLCEEKKEYVLSKQLLKSGTSIGANVSEALAAESSADFIHKLSISQKEADETMFWLELLKRTQYLSEKQFESLVADCREIKKLITSIILTTKQNSGLITQNSKLKTQNL